MGSKGSQTVTNSGNQQQSYTPNQPILGMTQNAGSMATTAAGAPFQQPVAPVAPFTPFQSIGFGETLGLQGMAQPYFNTAGNYLAGSAAPVTGDDVSRYLNPMTSNVTAQLQNIFGQQNVQNTGNLVNAAGGVGADRVAVGQANMANQQTLAAGQVYSQLYQQALQAAEQNKQMQAGAGFAFGQMGPAAQAAQQNAVNQLLGVGAQQQGLNQQQLNAIYQNQLARIAYPFQTAQYLSGITAGLAPAAGGQTTGSYSGQTTYPSPSPLAQGLGIGFGALGMFGGMGGMGAMGLGAMGAMPFGSAMQYLPGGSAYGATPSFQNGGYYPMFPAADGGAIDSNYGNLASQEKYKEFAKEIGPAAQGNPIAETFLKDVGYDDGGRIQLAGDVVPFDQHYFPNITLREALERSKNRNSPGAQGFAGAPEEAVDRAQQAGVLKIHPLHGFDDGGGIDQTIGQAAPMSLNIDPTNAGLPFPGSGRVSGKGVVPMTQFTGQPGRSGPYGQYMFMHGPPSMPQGGGQSPMGGGGLGQLGQGLGQLGGSLGKMLGGFGGSAGAGAAADAGAGIDFTGLTGGLGASIDEIGAALPAALMLAADGGSVGPPLDIRPDAAKPQPNVPLPRPRHPVSNSSPPDYPTPNWLRGDRVVSAGGAVGHPNRHWDYLKPMQPETFQEGGEAFTAEPDPTIARPEPRPFMDTMSNVWHYVTDRPPPKTAIVPPEVQSQYASEGHPNLKDQDRPFENVPSDDESLAYGPGVGRRVGPAETLSDTTGRDPAVIQRQGSEVLAQGPHEDLPMDPFGHGMQPPGVGRTSGAMGAISQPQQGLDYERLRRTTRSMETWQPGVGDKRGDPYQNISPSRRADGSRQEALGAYGIMDFNLPEWSKATFGRVVSKQEFLSHPELQDAIHDKYMGDLVHKYGIVGAGRAWLGGEGALNAPMRTDPYGTRVGDYGNRFAAHYNNDPGGGQALTMDGQRRSTNIEDSRQGAMGSPMANFRRPFPNATDPENFARRYTGSVWSGIADAGARMAQTRGPIGSVLGAGLEQFNTSMRGQRQELNTEEAMNERAEHLALLAQAHLDQYTKMKPYEQEHLDIMREALRHREEDLPPGAAATAYNKIYTDPTIPDAQKLQRYYEEIDRIREGLKRGKDQGQGQAPARPPGVPDNYVYGKKDGVMGWGDPAVMDKS